MTQPHEFDALAVAAHQGNTKVVGERDFVRAALALEAWYMIGVAPDDAPDELEPLIGSIQQAPHVLVFTDEERAGGFTRMRARNRSESEPAPVVHLTPGEALDYLETLREAGVQGAHFNDGEHSVTVDAARIVDIANAVG